ncbi:Piwi-domain-containing protein [Hypoxylon sp. FL1150]|nr:Piwi-domain-containing protein [Hypoxylon sp. FL1150]
MSGRTSRVGSVSGSRRPTPAASQVGAPSRSSGHPTQADAGKPKQWKVLTPAETIGKRVDLPADAYRVPGKEETVFAARPGYNTDGKPIQMALNIFAVNSFSNQDIYQYDVTVSPNKLESNALVKKVWNHETITKHLSTKGGKWLFDGNKLAWSSKQIDRNEARISVNLDALKQQAAAQHPHIAQRVGRISVYEVIIRQTKVIRLSYLKAYLEGRIAWDAHVLECMNFFDHAMRQFPSEQWVTIKRNFYDPAFPVGGLAGDLVVNQGIYVAPRLSESIARGGTGLAINVDRCQTAFWPEDSIDQIALRLLNSQKEEWQGWNEYQFMQFTKPIEVNRGGQIMYQPSEPFMFLRRLAKLKFVVNHRNKLGEPKIYTVKRLIFDPKYKTAGATSYTVKFDKKMKDKEGNPTGEVKETSVYDHYWDQYQIKLRWAYLPIIESSRGGLFPMELCNTISHQRYNYKLNPQQTSDMIRQAATRPQKRKADIMEGVTHLKWSMDPCLKAFGINVNSNMVVSNARLLQNPEVAFANQKINPGVSGRWDLRGKKFLEPNAHELKSWSFICCGDDGRTCHQNELENFARQFSNIYRNHGGKIAKPALAMTLSYGDGDFSKICEKAYKDTGNHFGAEPQIIFFVLASKNQLVYERIKRSMDCRYNIVSQCLWGPQVRKAQAQYMSNVAMKVNSKLGGVTCKVPGPTAANPPFWKRPTMVIGVDVSHGASGSQAPSMAALTMSMDKHGTRYAAACETNGYRKEIVQEWAMDSMLPKLLSHWRKTNGVNPVHVFYIRDGVSEGQFHHVLDEELKHMKTCFEKVKIPFPQFTVIIATKRHHVRFFPKPNDKLTGDRNGNPLPGTLVERDVTHPKHYDFYLCSHVAIQGTARPVHYQVIRDDTKMPPNELQKMIYQQCYQYCRSTTPVSLHPAVYYSHLASNRARSHESGISPESRILAYGKSGFPVMKGHSELNYTDSREEEEKSPPLTVMHGKQIPMSTVSFMNTTMWYV